MNTIEEQLWNYIDGTCTPAEQAAIARLIEQDDVYNKKYTELLALNQQFATMELDEPPMAFTYNVMEAIRTEQAMQPLKSAINKKIIWSIAAFFGLTILALLVFVAANINLSGGNLSAVEIKLPAEIKLPQVSGFLGSAVVKGFIIFDVVLAMFLTDTYLRRKKTAKQA